MAASMYEVQLFIIIFQFFLSPFINLAWMHFFWRRTQDHVQRAVNPPAASTVCTLILYWTASSISIIFIPDFLSLDAVLFLSGMFFLSLILDMLINAAVTNLALYGKIVIRY